MNIWKFHKGEEDKRQVDCTLKMFIARLRTSYLTGHVWDKPILYNVRKYIFWFIPFAEQSRAHIKLLHNSVIEINICRKTVTEKRVLSPDEHTRWLSKNIRLPISIHPVIEILLSRHNSFRSDSFSDGCDLDGVGIE